MKKFDEILKEGKKPGTMIGGLMMALLFFVFGLLFVYLGFWRTLLIGALTALGYFLGATEKPLDAVKALINRMLPSSHRTVTYSKEDMEKVQKALEKKDKAKAEKAEKQDKPEKDEKTEEAQQPPVQKD